MKGLARYDRVWASSSKLVFFMLIFGCWTFASGQESKRSDKPAKLRPNSPQEPFRAGASLSEAATFLDSVALDWTRQRKCGTCHTNYPYLVARPVIAEPATAAMDEIRGVFRGESCSLG